MVQNFGSIVNPTFQIRFEIVLARAAHLSYRQTIDALVDILNEPIQSTCSLEGCSIKHSHRLGICSKNQRSQWSVQMTPNVCSGQEAALAPEDICLQTVAIQSPVFGYRKPRLVLKIERRGTGSMPFHEPWVSPERQIEHILNRLNSINEASSQDEIVAVYTNSNCSFHVKVGDDKQRPFSTRTIKTLLKFAHLFEGQFDSIQSASRIRRGEMDALACVGRINSCMTWTTLMSVLHDLPITYSSLDASALPRTGMIDFCQHAATLDFDEITAWIHTGVMLTIWADNMTSSQAKRYFENRWADLSLSLPRILVDFSRFGKRVMRFAYEHYWRMQYGIDGRGYAEVRYEEMVRNTAEHPLRALLHHVAAERYLDSNRVAVNLVINQKILAGEYGWLPKGSPIQADCLWLPIKNQTGREGWMVSYQDSGTEAVDVDGLPGIEVTSKVLFSKR